MRWPWVSRGALDGALAEIEWLRGQNERLQDQLVRIQRKESGLPEEVRQPKPTLEPMPKKLQEYIAGFASPSIRRDMAGRMYRRHARGEPWATMLNEMQQESDDGA